MKKVLVGGGSGQIGRYVVDRLVKAGHHVTIATRSEEAQSKVIRKMGEKPEEFHTLPPQGCISWNNIKKNGLPLGTDVVINLTGHTIGAPGLWTRGLRDLITTSRIVPTNNLVDAIKSSSEPPECFISASAVGVYENGNSKVFTEQDDPTPSGRDTFFTKLCKRWEETSQLPPEIPTRLVNARFGVVLAHNTEPMSKLLPATLHALPTIMGDGTQPFPWIHIHDAVSAVLSMMDHQTGMSGPVNVVAPNVNTNTDLAHALGKACLCGDKTISAPAALFKLMYGTERANNILLDSPRVAPGTLIESGFEFSHPELESAIEALVQEKLYYPNGIVDDWFTKTYQIKEKMGK